MTHQLHSEDPLYTVAEAGAYLSTGERFVRRIVNERRIPYTKVGRFVRLRRSDLDAFLARGQVAARDDVY